MRELWSRVKMALAVLRGRSVMYRMIVDGERGFGPKTPGAFVEDNYVSLPMARGRIWGGHLRDPADPDSILLPPQGDTSAPRPS